MAITNAQQYKQLLANGGRIGLKGGADAATQSFAESLGGGGQKGKDYAASVGARPDSTFRGGDDRGGGPTFDGAQATTITKAQSDAAKDFKQLQQFKKNLNKPNFTPGFAASMLTKVFPGNLDYRKEFLARNPQLLEYFESLSEEDQKSNATMVALADIMNLDGKTYEDFLAYDKGAPGLKYKGDVGNLEKFVSSYEMNPDGTFKLSPKGYKIAKTYDYRERPSDGGGGDGVMSDYERRLLELENQLKDQQAAAPTTTTNPFAYRFMADGGRAGFQEGGIMPRLNQLSGNVSSAEQMLQEINQRLESAESSLGSGGGSSLAADVFTSAGVTGGPQVSSLDKIAPGFKGDRPQFQLPGNIPGTDAPYSSLRGGIGEERMNSLNRSVIGNGFYDLNAGLGDNQLNVDPMLSPLQQAVGMADGGIMNADIVGGMMDGNIDDMGRQMYGLGKLVKKATRAVKKVAKSPLGKAALLYGLGAVGGSFGSTGKLFSKGMFNPGNMMRGLFGANSVMMRNAGLGDKAAMKGLFGKLGLTGGYGGLMPTLKGGLALASLAPLVFQGDEEEENFDPYRGPDIDIDKIRSDPYGAMGGAYRFAADGGLMRTGYQEGGDAEPVAKKTMPLIDMDGKEKDYRETGGFVDMGRMERADDVPARLSKNEFVFTADAVRNAGEGDIDKGAEVMYNMMKNLEAGGEVSEESQGLEGARNMFQTSQRLGEVI